MALEYEAYRVNPSSHVISSQNMIFTNNYKTFMATQFKARDNNPFSQHAGGGDNTIADGCLVADGDIIISCGWGDGFAVKKIDDAGNITQIYHDNTPNNSYAYYDSLAVDKARGVAYVGNHVYDNLAHYDYSSLKTGGTTVTKLGTLTEGNDGLPTDEIGDSYINGMAIAGDWLYLAPDDKWVTEQPRWNTQTKVAEMIPVTNLRNSAIQGQVQYNETTDRIYTSWNYNGELWVTLNASTSSPKTYNIRVESLGFGNDLHNGGIVEDNDNPNHIWFVGYRRIAKIDITACITDPVASGTTPTLIGGSTEYFYDGLHVLNGHTRLATNTHPEYGSDFLLLLADRGWLDCQGWYDQENKKPVAVSNRGGEWHASQDPLTYDYQPSPVLTISPNGTKYWVYGGYGYDGYRHHVYEYSKGYELETTSQIVLGNFTFSNNEDIDFCKIDGITEYIPSECSTQYYVSNNGGASWESYALGSRHAFSSNGNTVRIKIMFNGTPIKSPYLLSNRNIYVSLFGNTNYKPNSKRVSMKLGGRS